MNKKIILFRSSVALLLITLALMVSFTIYNQPHINLEFHKAYSNNLSLLDRDLGELDAELLKVNQGLRPFYDLLELRIKEVKRRAAVVNLTPNFVSDQDTQAIQDITNELQPKLELLDNHVQNFKRYFSLLRNSTNYLPELAKELTEQTGAQRDFEVAVFAILRQVLEARLTNSGISREQIAKQVEELKTNAPEGTNTQQIFLFQTHVDAVLMYDKRVREVTLAIETNLLPGIRLLSESVLDTYQQSFSQAQTSISNTMILLYAASAFLMVAVFIFVSLQLRSKRVLSRAIKEISNVMSAQAKGDLSHDIQGSYSGQLGELKKNFNAATQQLRITIGQALDIAEHVSQSAKTAAKLTSEVEKEVVTQTESLENTATSMDEISSTARQTYETTKNTDELANTTKAKVDYGVETMQETTVAMEHIRETSTKMQKIIDDIDDLAFQTNLLALNAAVEAAHAGDQGKGFAVVASEVRNLANRSTNASSEIRELIKASMDRSNAGGDLVEKTGKELKEIHDAVSEINTSMGEITNATSEQLMGVDTVHNSLETLDNHMQQAKGSLRSATESTEDILQQSRELVSTMSKFQLGDRAETKLTQNSSPHEFSAAEKTRSPSNSKRLAA